MKCFINNLDIMAEWDWEKNNQLGLDPAKLTHGSCKKAWWLCKNKHSWQTAINNKVNGKGCPYCSSNKLLVGFNDLQTINPKLASLWHPTKNNGLTPSDVTSKSGRKVWWLDACGHESEATVSNRSRGTGCPYCDGKKQILEGFNDLASQHPELANEWDYDKNYPLLPTQVRSGSNKKVWWKCKNGHGWRACINQRSGGTGCPHCVKELRTSFLEQTLYYYIKKYFDDAIWGYRDKKLKNFEVDVYIPSKNIGVEYDGERWHKDATRDVKKDKVCNDNGMTLYRIREPNCEKYNGTSIHYYLKDLKQSTFENTIRILLNAIGIKRPIVDIIGHYEQIQNIVTHLVVDTSLASEYPKIASEWHPTKNGGLNPYHIRPTSNKKVWWQCKGGHEWVNSISNRVRGDGCPYCSGRKVICGVNDLFTTYPNLALEWNYQKNTTIDPNQVSAGSNKRVWWSCLKCKRDWFARIACRTKGTGCPECAKRDGLGGASTSVMCIETGEVYTSIGQAERLLNIHHIGRVRDKQDRTAGGYHWKTINQTE